MVPVLLRILHKLFRSRDIPSTYHDLQALEMVYLSLVKRMTLGLNKE